MVTRIAVIGSADFIKTILSVAPQVKDIVIEPYTYLQPQEAATIIKNLTPCDAVFFSGALPYYFAKEITEELPFPTLFLEQNEVAVASSLLSITYQRGTPIERISIDLLKASFVTNILSETGISCPSLHLMDFADMLPTKFDTSKIINFHQSLFESGEVDLALTSVHAVYDKLIQLGIPVCRMIDPVNALIRGLQDAKTQAEIRKNHYATIAVGYISIKEKNTIPAHNIHEFAQYINANIQKMDRHTYTFYSSRGDIEALMESDAFFNYIAKFQEKLTIGFGYGATVREASQNARVAHTFAINDKKESCGYILTENKELLGPFPSGTKMQMLKNDDPDLRLLAKEIKLSPANLSKIIQFSRSRHSLQFTAADLSDYLQITRRSTERILKKMVDHGSINIVGEEMTYQQGRPRALYVLNIPVYS